MNRFVHHQAEQRRADQEVVAGLRQDLNQVGRPDSSNVPNLDCVAFQRLNNVMMATI